MKLLPFIAGFTAANTDTTCEDNQRLIQGFCVDKCDLFIVQCDVEKGFTIEVDLDCRDEQYKHLNNDDDTFFIGNTDFFVNSASLSDGSTVNPDAECIFTDGKITDLGFDKCGGFPFTQGDEYQTHTGWINHRVTVGSAVSSFMDEIKIECQIEHITLNTDNENGDASVNLSPNDENTGTGTIADKKLIEDLGLKLQVGTTKEGGEWSAEIQPTEKIDVGSQIQVRLASVTNSQFKFALRDCSAESNNQNVPLYDKFCPNKDSALVNLVRLDSISYNLNVFRIGSATSLTFKCKVSLFPTDGDLPTCPAPSEDRKRRDVAVYERFSRSASNDGEVTFTIEIAGESSGASETCANIFIPSLFFYALY